MLGFNRFSIRSRLLIIMLFISITSVIVVGFFTYRYAQSVIRERIFEQLTSVRVARSYEIETYIAGIVDQVRSLGEDFTIVEATSRMRLAYKRLAAQDDLTSPELIDSLATFYAEEFLPRLAENIEAQPILETYLPKDSVTQYLQYHYIANNPNALGEKDSYDAAFDGTTYTTMHETYHPNFRNLIDTFGYYDMFLIDAETGDIIYSVFKEADFATNLYTGPYASSGLGRVVQEVRDERDLGYIAVSDFSTYRPSYNAPGAFVATPIYFNEEFIGILAFQFPIDEINRIMTTGQNWRESGLGETGETYLVGPDFKMRSISRFLIDDSETYFSTLADLGVSQKVLEKIRSYGSSLLLQEVDTEGVKLALDGKEGTRIIKDYRDVSVLSSFSPISAVNLDWIILAEMDLAEAYRPLYRFQRLLIFTTVGLVFLITTFAMLLASIFTRPIKQFIEGAQTIASGKTDAMPVQSRDEFGRLAQSLNVMVEKLKAQTEKERKIGGRKSELLASLVPNKMITQLLDNKQEIVEPHVNVTVLFARLQGLSVDEDGRSSLKSSIAELHELINLFDEATQSYGIEKVKTTGLDYLAVCGASVSRLDHAKRTIEFAQDMLRQLSFFNQQNAWNLTLSIGIDSGSIVTGFMGRKNRTFDLWGAPVERAKQLSLEAEDNSILISPGLREDLGSMVESSLQRVTDGEAWLIQGSSRATSEA